MPADPCPKCPHLFLDIDGVLNRHEHLPTGYSGINRDKALILNTIINRVPSLRIVISSAWRYLILQGDMTVKGFQTMLLFHGVECQDIVAGHTEADGPLCEEPDHGDKDTWHRQGLLMRAAQIRKYAAENGVSHFAVLDDLPLDLPRTHFVQTNPEIGLTQSDADTVVALLRNRCAGWSENQIDRFMIRRQQAPGIVQPAAPSPPAGE